MKKLLIISPNFSPINAADMHRIRQSLPYYAKYGWQAYVATVDPKYIEHPSDPLLLEQDMSGITILKIPAFSPQYTRKIGLGSLALRSLWFYKRVIDQFLKTTPIDLIFFSTTQFPVTILGNHWRRKFGIPYVIDMQDPWHNDYYRDKPKAERPKKYWFSYYLNAFLEPIAMRRVSAIISVSDVYTEILRKRYSQISQDQCHTIPFGAFYDDLELAAKVPSVLPVKGKDEIRMIYVGRGGHDMKKACTYLFEALNCGYEKQPELFKLLSLYFIGTSYLSTSQSVPTIHPIAIELKVKNQVIELPQRVPYFQALRLLQDADVLFVPGSDDSAYTASKIYPYIMVKKPLIAIFHAQSSVVHVVKSTKAGIVHTFNEATDKQILVKEITESLIDLLQTGLPQPQTDWEAFKPFTAEENTKKQVAVFNSAIQQ